MSILTIKMSTLICSLVKGNNQFKQLIQLVRDDIIFASLYYYFFLRGNDWTGLKNALCCENTLLQPWEYTLAPMGVGRSANTFHQ